MSSSLLFQYCPKLVVVNGDSEVLLCRRTGEPDLDGIFSLIGGKMEHGDGSIVDGITRERSEEVGADFKLQLMWPFSINAEFLKKDGSRMILPHFYARYMGGDIRLGEEYSEYRWVPIESLDSVSPLIDNVPATVRALVTLSKSNAPVEWISI